MEELQHFNHQHPLSLIYLRPDKEEEVDDEDEDEDEDEEDDFVQEDEHGRLYCNLCKERIFLFHRYYYECPDCDEYFLHKFCAELPTTIHNHPSHPDHDLILSEKNPYFTFKNGHDTWRCDICHHKWDNFFNYHCSICNFDMDIICATKEERKINHPSHPHQLEPTDRSILSMCNACGSEHQGIFYHCTTCSRFWIHRDCALLPKKLLIQEATKEQFNHLHPLTLAYSFPILEKKAKFYPRCRVCAVSFFSYLWLYKCDKCRYYVHVYCAASMRESFLSILLPAGLGRLVKNFKDEDYPNLLHCPFPDESYNLLKHRFFKEIDFKNDGKTLSHFSHQHPLILVNSYQNISLSLHNPMNKTQLQCDGCLKPITNVPFYKCSEESLPCVFVLHEWCARLPTEIQDHPGHPQHKIILLTKVHNQHFGTFECDICQLPCNKFAYGCITCSYYIDVNCGFIPDTITHEAHPNHLLSRIHDPAKLSKRYCNACGDQMEQRMGFHCPPCDFYLHIECALLLPRTIRHKFDKHPLTLRYYPVENHKAEYFCEICEEEFDPEFWFYHCATCVQSMHSACAPLILQCEQAMYPKFKRCVYQFLNVKFGGTHDIESHPHPLTFDQGIEDDDPCIKCHESACFMIIFKCVQCKFVIHQDCASSFSN